MYRSVDMKRRKKKGTEPMQTQHPRIPHTYLSRVEHICLCLTIAFLVLFLGGHYLHHDPMKFTGLGIGITILMIQTDINLSNKEDDEDDD